MHYNLGLTYKAQGDLSTAICHYQRAIVLQPDYADAYQNLGVAWLKAGNVSESLAAFRQVIERHEQQGSPEAERLRRSLQSMGFAI